MKEKKINLEGILYNENGSFRPLTSSHGNIIGELSNLRNTYMEAERDYFEYLLTDKNIFNSFKNLLDEPSETLFARAIKLQEQLEYGDLETEEEKTRMKVMTPEAKEAFHMQKLELAEGFISLLFAAARDKSKIKELVLAHENSKSR